MKLKWAVSVTLANDPNGAEPVLALFENQNDADHWAEMIGENPEYEQVHVRDRETESGIAAMDMPPADDPVEVLRNTLIEALPYVEMAEHDDAYKPGVVAKMVRKIHKALALVDGREVPNA